MSNNSKEDIFGEYEILTDDIVEEKNSQDKNVSKQKQENDTNENSFGEVEIPIIEEDILEDNSQKLNGELKDFKDPSESLFIEEEEVPMQKPKSNISLGNGSKNFKDIINNISSDKKKFYILIGIIITFLVIIIGISVFIFSGSDNAVDDGGVQQVIRKDEDDVNTEKISKKENGNNNKKIEEKVNTGEVLVNTGKELSQKDENSGSVLIDNTGIINTNTGVEKNASKDVNNISNNNSSSGITSLAIDSKKKTGTEVVDNMLAIMGETSVSVNMNKINGDFEEAVVNTGSEKQQSFKVQETVQRIPSINRVNFIPKTEVKVKGLNPVYNINDVISFDLDILMNSKGLGYTISDNIYQSGDKTTYILDIKLKYPTSTVISMEDKLANEKITIPNNFMRKGTQGISIRIDGIPKFNQDININ